MENEIDVAMAKRRREPARLHHRLARERVTLADLRHALLAADHRRDNPAAAHRRDRLAGEGDLAIAQHSDAVGQGDDFLELVTDEDDRLPFRPQAAQHREERFGLVA